MKNFDRNPNCQSKVNCNEKALQDIVDEAMPYLEPDKHQLKIKLFPCELHQLVMQRKLAKVFPELKETQIRKIYLTAPFSYVFRRKRYTQTVELNQGRPHFTRSISSSLGYL